MPSTDTELTPTPLATDTPVLPPLPLLPLPSLPLTLLLPPPLPPMPLPPLLLATLVSDTPVLDTLVLATLTARGLLMPSLRLMPTTDTATAVSATDMPVSATALDTELTGVKFAQLSSRS